LAVHVVVFIQENKTLDFLLPSLRDWGANVRPFGTPLTAAPAHDQPHDRNAWVHYRMGDYPAVPVSVDDERLVPLYSWLAKQHTFCDHHFGAGSNSTSGHLLAFCGQTPTFKNPPFTGTHPVWDLPTVFGLAERAGMTWGAFTDQDGYPVKFIRELFTQPMAARVFGPGKFKAMAAAGALPQLSYVWSPAGFDEHPPFTTPIDPDYLAKGHDLKWQEIDAVVAAGLWADTTFILTYDDWGGYGDHVTTPSIETLPDSLHPGGFQAIGGSRLPLIMFGGHVVQGVDNRWHSHASIAKTVIDLLGLPGLGVPRVDTAPSLANRVDPGVNRPLPPRYGTTIVQPTPPSPNPRVRTPKPWPPPLDRPMPRLVTNTSATLPAPTDGTVSSKPPKAPV
jgi:phospholipase C